MLTFDEARRRLLDAVRPLPAERVPVELAAGRVLAEDVAAAGPLPPFDASAMDGYALAVAVLAGEGPWELSLAGESRAGEPPPALLAGTCMRILTGAPLPAGADAVVMQEKVGVEAGRVRFTARPAPGQNVRRAGEDLPAGAPALASGTRLGFTQVALAAAADRGDLLVARRPQVAILATGSELRRPGSVPRPASIPESNAVALAAMASLAGASVRVLPAVADDAGATVRAIEAGLSGSDVLLTVGGVSVGDHDVVRPALERAGVALDFWKVAIKPGKPLAVGRSPTCTVLGLPGNPASAIVTFALFGMPLLRALQGDRAPLPSALAARLAAPVRHATGRMEFLRVRLAVEAGILVAAPLPNQASGSVPTLAQADALAVLPAEVEALEAGASVEVIRFSDL
jgi:molybdopterin molybdotransferase